MRSRMVDSNAGYIPADVLREVPLWAKTFSSPSGERQFVWLDMEKKLTLKEDFSFFVRAGGDPPYKETIKAGASVRLRERGTPQFPYVWEVVAPAGKEP